MPIVCAEGCTGNTTAVGAKAICGACMELEAKIRRERATGCRKIQLNAA